MYLPNINEFPKFSLKRLLSTCFGNNDSGGKQICILIDLPDLALMHGHKFLDSSEFSVQKYAHDVFLQDLKNGVSSTLPIEARSNIKMIEISPDNRTLIIVDIGKKNYK